MYYTFGDVSIIPTILTTVRSRKDVNVNEKYTGLDGKELEIFPVFGASMKYMRSKFATDIAKGGSIHILPRVGLTDEERLEDISRTEGIVGSAIGLKDSEEFLKKMLKNKNLKFLSLDIAHAATSMSVEVLANIAELGIDSGVIIGTVGSVQGFAFVYKAMDLLGFKEKIVRVGIGAGAACTTRVNAGVGVGQFTLLNNVYNFIQHVGIKDVKIISDGGITCPGDLSKALTRSNGAMVGRYFASNSFEDDVLVEVNGEIKIKYYGMASSIAKGDGNYVEGGVTFQPLVADRAYDVLEKLKQGVQSAMTYIDSVDLEGFRNNARLAYNSIGTIKESNTH
ncbi:MAG TPA: IMP dehydrogenase [Candidatus Dojkabacteria bacterium]|nr:IMP dehydrogenase [Candidatus Dojkabacteria bacterium]